jgi:biopolymer transport protein ExbD
MAGISTSHSNPGRKSVDQEVSMVPFIDLLIVTISFLLVTAVWTSMARVPAAPQVTGEHGKLHEEEHASLRVKVTADGRASLQWQKGTKVDDVETVAVGELAGAMQRAWIAGPAREPGTSAILAVPANMPMGELTSVMDSIHSAKLPDGRSAFAITLSTS